MVGQQRHVLSARILGALHRDSPKLKVFMVSVSWSDETDVIVYRSFQDFKKFHRLLKKRFPQLNPFRKNGRLIPKFREGVRGTKQKGSSRSLRRMKMLDGYLDRLLRCEAAVTQSAEVTQFFTPKDRELHPDYTRNSIMLLLSDDLPDASVGGGITGGRQPGGSITNPFVTQSYRCVDAYETKDTKNRPFKVAVDEKLDVLIKDQSGWWLVENESKSLAWFPAPYLEVWEGEEGDFAPSQTGGFLYCAVRSYTRQKEDEVSVPIGSAVDVLRKTDNGWWLIRFNGKVGYIPSMYLQPYNNPRAGLHSRQVQTYSSNLNLATQKEEQSLQLGPAGRLHKARSLDVLSESLVQSEAELSPAAGGSLDLTSSEFSLSSSDSESTSSLRALALEGPPVANSSGRSSPERALPLLRHNSVGSTRSSGSGGSKDGVVVSPRVPSRPKTEEILNRCTTMTRKAAMATRSRLQAPPADSIYSR